MTLKGAQVYVAAAGTEPGDDRAWQPLGVTAETVSLVEEDGQDLYAEPVKYMRRPVRSVTATFKLSKNRLERRALLRKFFGIESGSLIHNGKKRRK